MARKNVTRIAALVGAAITAGIASADVILHFSDPSGLAGEAEFTLINSTTMEVRLRNTSTGVPPGFDNSDQILTSISWDFEDPGVDILGGMVVIGATSQTINFDTGSYGPGTDVGGEWGYGNGGTTGLFRNFISANTAGATEFGGPNLDGPVSLNGPQGGLVADPLLIPIGGLGAIQDEIVATLTLSSAIDDLSFLTTTGATIEFGSDAAFLFIPAPASFALLTMGGLMVGGRRRRHT